MSDEKPVTEEQAQQVIRDALEKAREMGRAEVASQTSTLIHYLLTMIAAQGGTVALPHAVLAMIPHGTTLHVEEDKIGQAVILRAVRPRPAASTLVTPEGAPIPATEIKP